MIEVVVERPGPESVQVELKGLGILLTCTVQPDGYIHGNLAVTQPREAETEASVFEVMIASFHADNMDAPWHLHDWQPLEQQVPPKDEANGTVASIEDNGTIMTVFVLMDPDENGDIDTKRVDFDRRMYDRMYKEEDGNVLGRRVAIDGDISIVFI